MLIFGGYLSVFCFKCFFFFFRKVCLDFFKGKFCWHMFFLTLLEDTGIGVNIAVLPASLADPQRFQAFLHVIPSNIWWRTGLIATCQPTCLTIRNTPRYITMRSHKIICIGIPDQTSRPLLTCLVSKKMKKWKAIVISHACAFLAGETPTGPKAEILQVLTPRSALLYKVVDLQKQTAITTTCHHSQPWPVATPC